MLNIAKFWYNNGVKEIYMNLIIALDNRMIS
jgi:hypothetical protein